MLIYNKMISRKNKTQTCPFLRVIDTNYKDAYIERVFYSPCISA